MLESLDLRLYCRLATVDLSIVLYTPQDISVVYHLAITGNCKGSYGHSYHVYKEVEYSIVVGSTSGLANTSGIDRQTV